MDSAVGSGRFQDGNLDIIGNPKTINSLKYVEDMKRFLLPHPNRPTEPTANLDSGILFSDLGLTFSLLAPARPKAQPLAPACAALPSRIFEHGLAFHPKDCSALLSWDDTALETLLPRPVMA